MTEEFDLSDQEYFEFSRRLENYHAIFYKFWEIGKPIFSRKIQTAAVAFNTDGNFVEFSFNPDFWQTLTDMQREFVVCHESLHIILDHGSRTTRLIQTGTEQEKLCANVAMDVVVNHMLVEKFGFDRTTLDFEQYVWIDKVFPGEDVPTDENFEFYFNLLNKKIAETNGDCENDGSTGNGSGSPSNSDSGHTVYEDSSSGSNSVPNASNTGTGHGGPVITQRFDDHSNLPMASDPGLSDKIDQIAESLSDQEANEIFDRVMTDLDEVNASRGCLPGDHVMKMNMKPVPKKKKWETVIKKWAIKHLDEFEDIESWTDSNRRIGSFMKDIYLPTEVNRDKPEKSIIDLYFYLDTSGSCKSLAPRFWKAALSLPQDRFKVHLFCFDTRVYETDLKSGKLYGFGGTSFDILEHRIQKDLKDKKIKSHPKGVFVITDGYGNNINPAKPECWHWFLSSSYRECIPKTCNVHKLSDFE